jgi:hypothetical protein
MKKGFVFMVLLIVCFSCGINNKPVSDAQKEKIKGEVKEVMSTIIKGVEETNFDMFTGNFYDSPDFVFLYNGNPFNYQQFADLANSILSTLINAKCTIVDEKYMVIDNSSVLYTGNTKWQMNYKDGHAILDDPWALQYIFMKVDNKWKVISANESGIEKSIPNETVKGLNQVELMGQLKGVWQANVGKDTVEIWDCQPYGKSFTADVHQTIKGQKVPVYVNNTSFDSNDGTFKGFTIWSNGNYGTWIGLFTNEKMLSGNFVWDFHADMPWGKFQIEFVNPQEFTWNYFNNDGVKTSEMTYKKVK